MGEGASVGAVGRDRLRPVLVVDDEQSNREMLEMLLQGLGLEVQTAADGAEAIGLLEEGARYALVLTDLKMPRAGGLQVLERVKALDPPCQVVLMTAYATAQTALHAIKEGAYDYITKPFKLDAIEALIDRALEKHGLVAENLYLREALEERRGMGQIIGESEPMQQVFEMVARVAPTPTTVLLTGESGTGKELVARAIHDRSEAAGGAFVAVNCGAIPPELIESELFGHIKGAFTGAGQDRPGLFEAADGGTIFLDEIGEMPLNVQVRLLRVLQERAIKPVGGVHERRIDCRVLAATNRDLRQEVEAGRFREDLFYRLNVIQLELPPLRRRGSGDIRLLIEHYLERYGARMGRQMEGVEARAMRALLDYSYPGNVRELQNIVERAVTLSRGPLIELDVLPYGLQEEPVVRAAQEIELPQEGIELEVMVERLERTLIEKALERSDGVKTEAAKLLGIPYRSLRYRLDKYQMG